MVVFSPDARTLATAANGIIRFWDLTEGAERYAVSRPHDERVFAGAFSPDNRTLAFSDDTGSVYLLEVMSGQVRRRLQGHRSPVHALTFSPNGHMLASASMNDPIALVWDVAGVRPGMPIPRHRLTVKKLESLWAELADADAVRADQAMRYLAAGRFQVVDFLRARLAPAAPLNPDSAARLIADLNSDRFGRRRQAARALAEMRDVAGPILRRALADQPSPEVRRQLTLLLEERDDPVSSRNRLRELRALEVLERIGSAEARRLLETLSQGTAEARLTREARASVERLTR
jgi:hypothetical protein